MQAKQILAVLTFSACCLVMSFSSRAHAVNQVRFCAQLTNRFTDNLPGQAFLVNSHIPASNHWAVVQRAGVNVGTPDYMGNTGCTPFTTINPGSYTFWVTSAVRFGVNRYLYAFAHDDEQWMWNSLTVNVAANPTGDTTIQHVIAGADWFAASLVATRMGQAESTPATIKVFAFQECPGLPGNSCNAANGVYLAPGHADVKSIVAHELGHRIADMLYGGWFFNYDHNVTQPLCRCDHVAALNQLHCMQSREQDGAARNEGWPHYYAAHLFNGFSSATAPFAYYKEVLEPPGNIPNDVVAPPYAFPALGDYRWTETRCLTANRNSELDWMAFMYSLSTQTSQSYTFANQRDVFRAAGSANHSWAALQAAANSVFGFGTAKAQHLIATGDSRGVDH